MKSKNRAFTLLELVFVIVVVGILTAVILPRTKTNPLQEAAIQLLSDIRYTQHLAMVDDRYDSDDANKWFKTRWQIFFAKTKGSDNNWAYTIFSDKSGKHTGNPDISEIAKNSENPNIYLTGGYSKGILPYYKNSHANEGINPRITPSMNLGHHYNISNVKFKNCGKSNKSRRIAFDYLGRPLVGNIRYLTSSYAKNGSSYLLQTTCNIMLSDTSGTSVTINVEPETGYIHIK